LSAWPDDWTPAEAKLHADTVERIRLACVANGVAPGMHTGDGAVARRYLEGGFQMVTVINELGLITVGAKAHMAMARGETASAAAGTTV
jgi:2-keto-3-deoxy-L-rhamnonate aldolase RhmA